MLLLDSEALSALAHGPARKRQHVGSLVKTARRRQEPIGTVAAVLAEVVRGRQADASVFAALRRERVEIRAVDTEVGVRAGQLLGSVRGDSAMAVDAFVMAVADLAGGAVIATVDTGDMNRLAGVARANITVASIDA